MPAPEATKTCTKCEINKPVSEFYRRRNGYKSSCKRCLYLASKDQRAKFRRENATHVKRQKSEEYQRHKDDYIARAAKWSLANSEKSRTIKDRWYRKNRDAFLRKCADRHRDNPEKLRQRVKAWRKKNPGKRRAQSAKRRAQVISPSGASKDVKAFYEHVAQADRIRCYWCNRLVKKSHRQVDHIVPLARGGQHAVINLCCSCSTCNNRKHAKTAAEFVGQDDLFANLVT